MKKTLVLTQTNFMNIRKLFLLCLLPLLSSCDALVSMSYSVENKTKEDIHLFIPNFPADSSFYVSGKTVDTLIHLKPNEHLVVGFGRKIDFPWGAKNIYKENPGKCGIERVDSDSTIRFGCTKEEWKYKRKNSTLVIN